MRKLLTMMVAAFFGCPLFATTWYVNGTSGSDSYSGTSSASAKKTIQAAIDVAAEGDIILVAAGMYTPVCCMNKRIVVKSTAGASVTAIVGAEGKRCVTIQNYGDIPSCDTFAENGVRTNTVIEGFALMDGHPSMFGNGGGGANGGTLRRCIIRDCEASGGGGAASAVLESCLVDGNRAVNGGNIIGCVAINCTIVNGYATDNGGGYYNCSVLNSIAFGNDSGWRWGDDGGQSYQPSGEGGLDGSGRVVYGVVKENPGFVDAAKGDYRLAAGSPCIDAGDNSYVTSETDLDGKARIVNGKVDIGCYEYQGGGGGLDLGPADWTIKHTFNGFVVDSDGVPCGLIQVTTAKETKKGVKVGGFVMLEDGKKVTMKAATVTTANGALTVDTTVGMLGSIKLSVGGSGFSGSFGSMKVGSANVGRDSGVLKATVKVSYFDKVTGKLKTKSMTLNSMTSEGCAFGTLTPKKSPTKKFDASVD